MMIRIHYTNVAFVLARLLQLIVATIFLKVEQLPIYSNMYVYIYMYVNICVCLCLSVLQNHKMQ